MGGLLPSSSPTLPDRGLKQRARERPDRRGTIVHIGHARDRMARRSPAFSAGRVSRNPAVLLPALCLPSVSPSSGGGGGGDASARALSLATSIGRGFVETQPVLLSPAAANKR